MSQFLCLDRITVPLQPKNLVVKRLKWDWNDPSEIVREEILRLNGVSPEKCLYLNPMFKVTCSEPAAEFFLEARRCQREWSRVLTRQFGSANWRRKMSVTKNVLERRMTFSGIMFVDGDEVDLRRQYLMEADCGLHPEADVVLALRPQADACLKERDWKALAEMSRSELERQLSDNPLAPVYVLPGVTVMGFQTNGAFYAKVLRRSREWHRRLCRALGYPEYRRLNRQSDVKTKLLVLHGALVIHGAILLPGHWPSQQVTPRSRRTLRQGEAVIPPAVLGLNECQTNTFNDVAASREHAASAAELERAEQRGTHP
jgi:hypothetical protein